MSFNPEAASNPVDSEQTAREAEMKAGKRKTGAEQRASGPEWPKWLKEINPLDLEEALRVAADKDNGFHQTSRSQAENMADQADIELTPEEVRLYCAIREQVSPPMGGREPKKGEAGTPSWHLSDPEILAVVLRHSGDRARFEKFARLYLYISMNSH